MHTPSLFISIEASDNKSQRLTKAQLIRKSVKISNRHELEFWH